MIIVDDKLTGSNELCITIPRQGGWPGARTCITVEQARQLIADLYTVLRANNVHKES